MADPRWGPDPDREVDRSGEGATADGRPTGHGSRAAGDQRPYEHLAIVSLGFALTWLFGLGSLISIVTGTLALRRIDAAEGALRGRGMAIAGLAIGITTGVIAAYFWLSLLF